MTQLANFRKTFILLFSHTYLRLYHGDNMLNIIFQIYPTLSSNAALVVPGKATVSS